MLNPFHIMGVAVALSAALLCAIHGAPTYDNKFMRIVIHDISLIQDHQDVIHPLEFAG